MNHLSIITASAVLMLVLGSCAKEQTQEMQLESSAAQDRYGVYSPVGLFQLQLKEKFPSTKVNYQYCTAFINGAGKVMTAAHCLNPLNNKSGDTAATNDDRKVFFGLAGEQAESFKVSKTIQFFFGTEAPKWSDSDEEKEFKKEFRDWAELEVEDSDRLERFGRIHVREQSPNDPSVWTKDNLAEAFVALAPSEGQNTFRVISLPLSIILGEVFEKYKSDSIFEKKRVIGVRGNFIAESFIGAPVLIHGDPLVSGILCKGAANPNSKDDVTGDLQWMPGTF